MRAFAFTVALLLMAGAAIAQVVTFPTIANNGLTTLNGDITDSATTINVTSAAALGLDDTVTDAYITVVDRNTWLKHPETTPEINEIMQVTAVSTNQLTVTRAVDGSTASAFSDGDVVELRIVAAHVQRIYDSLTDGTDTIQPGAIQIPDDNKITLGTDSDFNFAYDELTDNRLEVTDAAGNLMMHLTDAGTTGNLVVTGTVTGSGGGFIDGSGTLNTIPKFTPDGDTVGNSDWTNPAGVLRAGVHIEAVNGTSSEPAYGFTNIGKVGMYADLENLYLTVSDTSGYQAVRFKHEGFGIVQALFSNPTVPGSATEPQIADIDDEDTGIFWDGTANTLGITTAGIERARVSSGGLNLATGTYQTGGTQISSDDLSDTASIAMLDEAETVTGSWNLSNAFNRIGSGAPNKGGAAGFDIAEFGAEGHIMANTAGGDLQLTQNGYFDGGTWKYIATDEAINVRLLDGTLSIRTAPSGTADTAITWSQKLLLSTTGNLTAIGDGFINGGDLFIGTGSAGNIGTTTNPNQLQFVDATNTTVEGDLKVDGNDLDLSNVDGFSGIKYDETANELRFFIDGSQVGHIGTDGSYVDDVP